MDGKGWGIVGGFVRVPAHHELAGVQLSFNGETTIEATLEPLAGTLPELEGGAAFKQTNWAVGGPTDFLGPGLHTIVAKGRFATGVEWCFDCAAMTVPGA